jgi:hypothetical protein
MEHQKDISNLPKLTIESLFDSSTKPIQNQKKKIPNPFKFTIESSLEGLQKVEDDENNVVEEKKSLRETSENWIG